MLYHSEDFTSSGNGLARYFTRQVTLADGFDARDIKVYFDAVRPAGTNFYAYYKVLPDSKNPRAGFIFAGVKSEIIGDYGTHFGGAAGDEVLRQRQQRPLAFEHHERVDQAPDRRLAREF